MAANPGLVLGAGDLCGRLEARERLVETLTVIWSIQLAKPFALASLSVKRVRLGSAAAAPQIARDRSFGLLPGDRLVSGRVQSSAA